MREFRFIHAEEDVPDLLGLAGELGLIIRSDHPVPTPIPDIIDPSRRSELKDGVFMLFQLEWIFGEMQFSKIEDGHNKGKFTLSPATNQIALTLYFGGERGDGPVSRLGSGFLSRQIDWYRKRDHTIQPAPIDVKCMFDTIRKRIDTGRRLRGGIHNYAVLKNASEKLDKGIALPPFDYIERPPEDSIIGTP
jgi:hypothetical protein